MLYEFVTLNREEIIRRCRAKVAARSIPPPSETEISQGIPLFLAQLADALRSGSTRSSTLEMDRSAAEHGHDLLLKGFTVSQVVHDYGDVCQAITGLAMETNAPIDAEDFRTLNRCLDEAIASAVTMYQRESHRSNADEAADRCNQRIGFLVHELRNLLGTAMVAFEVLKTGNVGLSGPTGSVLNRSLVGLRELISRSLEDVRLSSMVANKAPLVVSEFIAEVRAGAELEASTRGITLAVLPVQEDVTVEVDRQVLAAVVGNLLQNAFKFTRPCSTVTLRVRASTDRVSIEVQDECGGLPGDGDLDQLFRPFEQRAADRSGLGIGLAFSRWGAEANGGRLSARNLPNKGCVFVVDLPRASVPAAAAV